MAVRLARAFEPRQVAGRSVPSPWLLVLTTLGLFLLLVVATTAWNAPTDEQAYWRAATRFFDGGSMYDPTAAPGDANYGYWYPPPLAQVLAPFTDLIPSETFSVLWTILLLGCLWWLGGRNVFVAIALIAFLPVAVELRVRNVHLVLAVLTVLALRRSALFWIPAAAIKVAPVIGLVYLAAARRWREAIVAGVVGLAVLGLSVVLAQGAWRDFFTLVVSQAGMSGASLVPIPYVVRFGIGVALAAVAGWLAFSGRRRLGEGVLVTAIVLANPTLWVTAFSMLIALVPLWRASPASPAEDRTASVPQAGPAEASPA